MAKGPRYQVFISSTYRDLREERAAVQDAILRLGHFPIGMELFPATHGTPWELIQEVIKDSDYYVLVIGGRYGSLSDDGIGFTEREYDYAFAQNKRILAFIHESPTSLPRENTDTDPALWKKLTEFREKVQSKHHRNAWTTPEQLKVAVLCSLLEEIRRHPMQGWVPNDGVDREGLLLKLTDLQDRYDAAQAQLAQFKGSKEEEMENLAGLNRKFNFSMRHDTGTGYIEMSLAEILVELSPTIIAPTPRNVVHSRLMDILAARRQRALSDDHQRMSDTFYRDGGVTYVNIGDLTSEVALDLIAMELITIDQANVPVWQLTSKGAKILRKVAQSN